MSKQKSVLSVWDEITQKYVGIPALKGADGADGADGQDYVLTDADKAEIAATIDAVKFTEQELTADQKKQACENIGIPQIDTEQVTRDGIPTGQALDNYLPQYISNADVVMYKAQGYPVELQEVARENIGAFPAAYVVGPGADFPEGGTIYNCAYTIKGVQECIKTNAVTFSKNQEVRDERKQQARINIDVDGGRWEKLFTFTGDGDTAEWEFTQFADGTPLKLTAVAVYFKNTAAYSSNSQMGLFAYYNGTAVSQLAISSALSTNAIAKATALIVPFMGRYAAISVNGHPYTSNMVWRHDKGGFADIASVEKYPYFDKVGLANTSASSVTMQDTTTVEIWGVRYYE